MLRSALLCTLCCTPLNAAEPTEIIRLWSSTPPGPIRVVGDEADVTKPEDKLIEMDKLIPCIDSKDASSHDLLEQLINLVKSIDWVSLKSNPSFF